MAIANNESPYDTLKKRGIEFVEVHNHDNIKLYVCNLNDNSFRVGIVWSDLNVGETSFVIKQPRVLRKFCEQVLRLLPEG